MSNLHETPKYTVTNILNEFRYDLKILDNLAKI